MSNLEKDSRDCRLEGSDVQHSIKCPLLWKNDYISEIGRASYFVISDPELLLRKRASLITLHTGNNMIAYNYLLLRYDRHLFELHECANTL